ncbi:hypothetical protein I553_8429 [Mycobacterium xenopi 4042]|uniref:Uncharacterized protein n=1 Tax=Mycobacterium xenopi 4042 TaxID=1299334 RepID=X7ZYF3_MYCXE|nr:hypothetical protein I553_8429 [Mycobacterium xenopi 4042]
MPWPAGYLRRDLINIPARFAARPKNQCCTYPPTGIGEPDGRPVAQRHRLPDRATPAA